MIYQLKILTVILCVFILSACGGNPPKSEAKRQFDVCMKPLLGPEFFMKCEETMGLVECTEKYQKKQRECKDAFLESKKDCP